MHSTVKQCSCPLFSTWIGNVEFDFFPRNGAFLRCSWAAKVLIVINLMRQKCIYMPSTRLLILFVNHVDQKMSRRIAVHTSWSHLQHGIYKCTHQADITYERIPMLFRTMFVHCKNHSILKVNLTWIYNNWCATVQWLRLMQYCRRRKHIQYLISLLISSLYLIVYITRQVFSMLQLL